MHIFLKNKSGDWIFWAVAIILFCILTGYVFYTLRYLLHVSNTAFGNETNPGTLIEHFDFAKLEQALGDKVKLLNQKPQ